METSGSVVCGMCKDEKEKEVAEAEHTLYSAMRRVETIKGKEHLKELLSVEITTL